MSKGDPRNNVSLETIPEEMLKRSENPIPQSWEPKYKLPNSSELLQIDEIKQSKRPYPRFKPTRLSPNGVN